MEIRTEDGFVVIVDPEDFTELSGYKWRTLNGYAVRSARVRGRIYTKIYMHRQIIRPEKGKMIDHINRDRLDNRKSNLRLCDHSLNGANRGKTKDAVGSRYKGVRKSWSRWRALIQFRKKPIHLGTFDTEQEAAKAYDNAAKKLFGEYSHLNFP